MIGLLLFVAIPLVFGVFVTMRIVAAMFNKKPSIQWIAGGVAGSIVMVLGIALLIFAVSILSRIGDFGATEQVSIWNQTNDPLFLGYEPGRELDPSIQRTEQHIDVFSNTANVNGTWSITEPRKVERQWVTFDIESYDSEVACLSTEQLPPALATSASGVRLTGFNDQREEVPVARADINIVFEFSSDFCVDRRNASYNWDGENLSQRPIVPYWLYLVAAGLIAAPLLLGAFDQRRRNRASEGMPPPAPPPPPTFAQAGNLPN